jgi:adenylosuccinate synthase
MTTASIVIGANWGDEGKGLVSAALHPDITVLCNGGPQRGHTVWHDGKRFVIHHFGSSIVKGIPTYLSKDFVINPMAFVREYLELREYHPITFVHPDCAVTFPQDIEHNRNTEAINQHGSCGMGVWSTIVRGNLIKYTLRDLSSRDKFDAAFNAVNTFYNFKDYGLTRDHFWNDVKIMLDCVFLTDDHILNNYDHAVFEMGQGLMLSMDRNDAKPHITASVTGRKNANEVLSNFSINPKLYYVTRAYATRHGNGPLPFECTREELNVKADATNISNDFQGKLRYGYLDSNDLLVRCYQDAHSTKFDIVLTHANETNGNILTPNGPEKPSFVRMWSYDEENVVVTS